MILTTEQMEKELQGWDFLDKLPDTVGSFVRVPGEGAKGQVLSIAKYVNEGQRRALELTYTAETGDFVPVKIVGLHIFRDIKYFYRNKDEFAEAILRALPRIIASIDDEEEHEYSCEGENYHFKQWEYGKSLPKKIGPYELYITPANPISYINGSYIFIDYTDFATGNQLCFFYNMFRNEIFAEKKKEYLPITTSEFTVMNKKLPKGVKYRSPEDRKKDDEGKLDRLAAILEEKLCSTLDNIAKP